MRFVFIRREGVSCGRKLGQSADFLTIGPGISEVVMRAGVELVGAHYLAMRVAATVMVMV